MAASRTWIAIPVLAALCIGLGLAAAVPPHAAVALGALGAALAAAVRAFAGPSIAAAVAGGAAALLGVLAVQGTHVPDLTRAAIAGGAAMFAIAELSRPMPPNWSPLPAVGGSLLAAVLDPSYIALPTIAGIRFLRGPWPQPRGSILLPIAGILGIGLAVLAALAKGGMLADLWLVWSDRAQAHAAIRDVLVHTGDVLGPVSAVAAALGIASCANRGLFPASSVVGVAAGAIAVDLVTGELGAATPIAAALGAGVAISRLTAMVRWPAGQAFVSGAVGFMLVVAPALALAAG